MEIISETLEKICGHRAEREQIVNFISDYVEHSSISENRVKNASPQVLQESPGNAIIHIPRENTRISKSFPPDGTVCQFSYKGSQYNGIIKNGRLQIDRFGSFSSFSAASVEVTKTSRNGWRDWEIKLPGDSHWQLSDTWRKRQKQS